MKQRIPPRPDTLKSARALRIDQPPVEVMVWARVRNRQLGGWKIRRQHPVGPYIVDFFAEDARLAIELDGDSHTEAGAAERDAARSAYLVSQGIRVLRFWNSEVRENLVGVLDTVLAELERQTPSPGHRDAMSDLSQGRGKERPAPRQHLPLGGARRFEEAPGEGIGPQTPPPMTQSEFTAATHVSHETMSRLEAFDRLLLAESEKHNLVARSTLVDRWRRHFLDSAQLFPLIPAGAKTLADLGSGAGFPGIVLAAMGAEQGLKVTLVESTGKKAAFLTAAVEAMRLTNVAVLPERIESTTFSVAPDVITARALAPLAKLAGYAHRISGKNTLCLFLKGQDVGGELTEAAKSWHMEVDRVASVTSLGSAILAVRRLAPKRQDP